MSNLVVVVDNQHNMSAHVTVISRSCIFLLCQLSAVRHSVSTDAAKTLVSAFISSRLDYCNSLFDGRVQGDEPRLLYRPRNLILFVFLLSIINWQHAERQSFNQPTNQPIIIRLAMKLSQQRRCYTSKARDLLIIRPNESKGLAL